MAREARFRLPGMEESAAQEAYRILRTNIEFCGADTRTIAITSAGPDEGKTTISICLAASLAELGKRVLLVDTDMRKSVLASRYSDVQRPCGLRELLSGQCKMADVLCCAQNPRIDIIFSGRCPPNPAELLSGSFFDQFLALAKETYDYILLDTAPLGEVVDAAVAASKCDGALLVIGEGLRAPRAREALRMLQKSGCRVLGAVMNQTGSKKAGCESQHRRCARFSKYFRMTEK